ncbi:uncharacterized protein LOC135218548 [Macrobrachium nipponense]|uniref:uncharacterized protein LOC135218548 n=1 Tax=Macrobrachium nipponense TaxID=159736 RepID=UPI0030C8BE8D
MVAPYSIGHAVRSSVRIPGSGCNRQARPVLLDLSYVSPVVAPVSIPQPLRGTPFRSYLAQPVPKANQPSKEKKDGGPCAQKFFGTPTSRTSKEVVANAEAESNGKCKRKHSENGDKDFDGSSAPLAPKRFRQEDSGTVQTPVQVHSAMKPTSCYIKQIYLVQTAQAHQELNLKAAQIATVAVSLIVPQMNQVVVDGGSTELGSFPSCGMAKTGTRPSASAGNLQSSSTETLPDQPPPSKCSMTQKIDQLRKENELLNQRLNKFINIFKSKEKLQYLANFLSQTL